MRITDYLIVDGYNVVFAWDSLRKLAARNIEAARERLAARLANYAGFNHVCVIAVFDAHLVAGGVEKTETVGGLTIVYTKANETADGYIERITPELSKNARVYVATDDETVQNVVMRRAIRLSCADLLASVKASERDVKEKIARNRPIKNNMFIDNVSPEMAKWLEAGRFGADIALTGTTIKPRD